MLFLLTDCVVMVLLYTVSAKYDVTIVTELRLTRRLAKLEIFGRI